ncbi:YdcF family protein [Patescibacteria group bacterium]|nr:YdcF family protein [Patescibacteria group bacterium]
MKSPLQVVGSFIIWVLLFGSLILAAATFTDLNDVLAKPLIRDEEPKPADVIIVLGGGVVVELDILPWGAQERVRRGVELYKEGLASKIIVAGGLVEGQTYTESQFLREYAEFFGVPSANIIEDNKSLDTYENAIYSMRAMEINEWETAIVVTSDFHTKRACRVFEKQKGNIICVAVPVDPSFDNNYFRNLIEFRSILREYLATAFYSFKGYI